MIYFLTKERKLFDEEYEGIKIIHEINKVFEYFKDKEFIGLDTETEGFDPYTKKVLLMQLGDKNNQFVIDCSTVPLVLFKELLEDESKTFILQNAKFDLRFLLHHSIVVKKVFDTYLAESVLFTGIKYARKALDFLVDKYLGATLNKEIRQKIHIEGNTERVIRYAAQDVEYLEDLMNAQIVELKRLDLEKALDLDNKFVIVLAYIEYCGIYLNAERWKAKMIKDLERVSETEQALNNFIIDNKLERFINPQLDLFSSDRQCNIKWSSSMQVIPLMKELGVDTKTIDKESGKTKDSVEADILRGQEDKSPLVKLYLDYKQAEKVVSTYGESWLKQINPVSNRIHSSFTQILNTGRLSCGGKQGGVELVNLQNIPADKTTRSCFTNQNEDSVLVVADYSGQESVVLANMSKDENLINFYKSGLADLHSFVAAKINPELEGLDLDTIKTQYKKERQEAKAANFAIA
jgi:DNA polymerase-1